MKVRNFRTKSKGMDGQSHKQLAYSAVSILLFAFLLRRRTGVKTEDGDINHKHSTY